jgi:hypothetical protein
VKSPNFLLKALLFFNLCRPNEPSKGRMPFQGHDFAIFDLTKVHSQRLFNKSHKKNLHADNKGDEKNPRSEEQGDLEKKNVGKREGLFG